MGNSRDDELTSRNWNRRSFDHCAGAIRESFLNKESSKCIENVAVALIIVASSGYSAIASRLHQHFHKFHWQSQMDDFSGFRHGIDQLTATTSVEKNAR